MKIISGIYKGRNLSGYTLNGTRPTQDRVKESLFAMIQQYIDNAVVLDLFAGSGNLGIEALSNGAKKAYFVDSNKEACRIVQKNLNTLNISNAKVFHMDYKVALNDFKKQTLKFDMVFLDPPYKEHIINTIISMLKKEDLLEKDALIICEYDLDYITEKEGLEIIKEKKYGNKYVKIFKNMSV